MSLGRRRLEEYRKNQFHTADRGTLLLMLYERAIDSLRKAKSHMEKGETAAKGACLSRAHAIVGELLTSLDFGVAGELPHRLAALYRFVLERILEAHAKQRAGAIDEALAVLEVLGQAWEEAVPLARKQGVGT
jgi:flagellar protein FliS